MLDVGKSLVKLLELNIDLGFSLLGFLDLVQHRGVNSDIGGQ